MINEILSKFFIPKMDKDWFIIKTNKGFYSLRLGGFKKEYNFSPQEYIEDLDHDIYKTLITNVISDGFWIYIFLDNDLIISSGVGNVDSDGTNGLEVFFQNLSDFDKNFFDDEDFYNLEINLHGSSIKKD